MKKTAVRKRPRGTLLGSMIRIAFLAFVIYAIVNIVSVQVGLSEKRNELAALSEKKQQLMLENEEYARLLSLDDEREYMEQIAIEKLDYAYPNEIRFYDTSKG